MDSPFGKRVAVVFKFSKSNFWPVMKYYFPIFVILGCIAGCLSSVMVSLVLFISTACFQQYIQNKKDKLSYGSYTYMLKKSLAPSFGINLIAGLCCCIFLLLPFLIIFIPIMVFLAFMQLNDYIVDILIYCVFFLFYLTAIIYQIHYFFSYEENKNKGLVTLFKDVFKLLKGNWFGSLAFLLFFGIVEFVFLFVVTVFLISFLEKGLLFNIILFTLVSISSFFFVNNAMIYQYGHLKSLQDNIKRDE